jgi:pyruvate,orthophosphate dikinase
MPAKKAKKVTKKAAKRTVAKAVKYSYDFGLKTDGGAKFKELLGGKGANLAEMARIGLPVPPGFTITTDVCTYFYDNGRQYPKSLAAEVKASVAQIEKEVGKKSSPDTPQGQDTPFPKQLLQQLQEHTRQNQSAIQTVH